MIITINTHHCTFEELQELINYLESNYWDVQNHTKRKIQRKKDRSKRSS